MITDIAIDMFLEMVEKVWKKRKEKKSPKGASKPKPKPNSEYSPSHEPIKTQDLKNNDISSKLRRNK